MLLGTGGRAQMAKASLVMSLCLLSETKPHNYLQIQYVSNSSPRAHISFRCPWCS